MCHSTLYYYAYKSICHINILTLVLYYYVFLIENFCWSKFKHAPHLITDWLQKDPEFKLITVIIIKLVEMTVKRFPGSTLS